MNKLMSIIAFPILIIAFSCAFAKEPENGLLWKITGNGLQYPSYLFGTFHGLGLSNVINNDSFLINYPKFFDSFYGTRQLIVENNPNIRVDNSVSRDSIINFFRNEASMPNSVSYSNFLNTQETQQLDSMLLKYLHLRSDKMKFFPIYLIQILAAQINKQSLRSHTGQNEMIMDLYITKLAEAKKYNVISLETALEQMRFFLPLCRKPINEQMQLMQRFLRTARTQTITAAGDALLRLIEAYKKHDLIETEKIKVSLQSDAVILFPPAFASERLIRDRNLAWMKKIESAMQAQPTFIAVGCAHLTGEYSLIKLLRKNGYDVEPVK
jgi:uncharacterized protein